jgi:shikimate dehydrogenase
LIKCGLLGKNIQYSRSPQIHNTYFQEKNLEIDYKLFDMNEEQIEYFIRNLKNNNILGFNVTIPYKQTIIKYLTKLIYPADKIYAVNTVVVDGNELVGYNTDYFGFIKSLESYNINLNGKNALIIGAGGAARCIAYALSDLNCSIVIAARNLEKAKKAFLDKFTIVSAADSINLMNYDIIINCTPLGGQDYKGKLPIKIDRVKENCIAYDLVYNPEKTEFLRKAEQLGAIIINGERMLIYQAYSAADIWIDKIKT